jgi:hypothetical protein
VNQRQAQPGARHKNGTSQHMPPAPQELKIIEQTYKLVVWSVQHIGRFPRSHRHSLGIRLEQRLYSVLERLLRAKFTRDRQDLLQSVNLELELLRFEFRLAKDLKCLSVESYGSASRFVNEIGRLLGGWIKQGQRQVPPSPPREPGDETTGTTLAACDELHEPAPIRPPRRPR